MFVALGLNETQSVRVSVVHSMLELGLTIAIRYSRVLDNNVIRLDDVPPISVLLEAEGVADSADLNVREYHIARVCYNVGPEGRVVQAEIRN